MADKTPIEWTDATWNPIGGCTRVDEGCRNCYAEIMAARFSDHGQWGHGLARRVKLADGTTDHRWTGQVRLNEAALTKPLSWRTPRRIFVNSTSDLFHESMPDNWIDQVFAVMALCPQHTFQVLTKRPERARAYMTGDAVRRIVAIYATRLRSRARGEARRTTAFDIACDKVGLVQEYPNADIVPRLEDRALRLGWPLPNVWLGTSVSDQASADLRIPELLATPAAVRFLSCEPMLGPVDLADLSRPSGAGTHHYSALECDVDPEDDSDWHGALIDWVICGGESGPHASPMKPAWARSLRNQCQDAGVPFLFKQWGEWVSVSEVEGPGEHFKFADGATVRRTGKKRAGRTLDGREWNEFPGAPR
jgi:protein gp37